MNLLDSEMRKMDSRFIIMLILAACFLAYAAAEWGLEWLFAGKGNKPKLNLIYILSSVLGTIGILILTFSEFYALVAIVIGIAIIIFTAKKWYGQIKASKDY